MKDISLIPIRITLDTQEVAQSLFAAAAKAREGAYAPTSHYTVGAAVLGGSGKIYAGQNMELTSQIDHGEVLASARALTSGEKSIIASCCLGGKEGTAPSGGCPCGSCRQAFYDINPKMIYFCADGDKISAYTSANNLPKAYFRKKPPWPAPPYVKSSRPDFIEEAFLARSQAYSIRAHYPIGAAVEAGGKIFRGSKVDISSVLPVDPLRMALAEAISNKEWKIERVAIVGGNTAKGETPPNLSWDAFQALYNIAPNAVVFLPDKDEKFVGYPVRSFLPFLNLSEKAS